MNTKELDMRLVEQAQAGDQRAFDQLVKKYYRKAIALVSRVVRDTNLVEDIVQDALIRAYCALPGFRGEASFYTWLYRIIINTAKNHLLNQKRYASLLVPQIFEEGAGTVERSAQVFETPEGWLQSKQLAHVLHQAVLSLPEEMRAAILLREIDGLSYEQIAIEMQCPVGTVRSRIFRAREVIAEQLQPVLERNLRGNLPAGDKSRGTKPQSMCKSTSALDVSPRISKNPKISASVGEVINRCVLSKNYLSQFRGAVYQRNLVQRRPLHNGI